MQEQASQSSEKKRVFRLVVGSAAEAVNIIQKKFGTGATVQSVKQFQPKGVSKLWSSPKLEIIVSIPAQTQPQEPFKIEKEEEKKPQETKVVSNEEAMPQVEDVTQETLKKSPESTKEPLKESETSGIISSLQIEDLLLQSQFDKTIIQRLKNRSEWESITQKSLKQGLTETITLLREEFISAQNDKIQPFTAFIGTPGVGTSTILRKYVANRVFVHGKKVQVLKLDDGDPNPDDMLNVFCEIIGIDLVRDPNDLHLESGTELYVDLPGVTRNYPERIRRFKGILDDLDVRTRVFVLNSLYDSHTLSGSYDLARKYGATHQTFTHLDELETWAKLWKFVLRGSLPLIFMNMGEESSSASKEEFLPLLISKTFPKILLN